MEPSGEDTATGPLRCPGGRGHDRPMRTFQLGITGDGLNLDTGGAVVAES